MAKASLRLLNGTNVEVEGTPEEIHKLLSFYGALPDESPNHQDQPHKSVVKKKEASSAVGNQAEPDIMEIVNLVKKCNESEAIEKHILDRTSNVDRTLLPLYIVHEYLGNANGLTSGDVNKVTTELGIPIATPNIANTLSGSASRYVMGDIQRKKGVPVRYKLSRKGLQYLKSVIAGDSNGK